MLSSVLRSPQAVAVNVAIMRAFIRLRKLALSVEELSRKIDDLENRYDDQFRAILEALRHLLSQPDPPRRQIGFHADENQAGEENE